MKNDKITLALLWSHYGGEVTSVNDLVLELDKERFNVIFIYLTGYGVERNFLKEAGYDVFYLSDIKRLKAPRLSILSGLVRVLKERNVDILHCHGHKPSFYGALAAIFTKTPVVLSHVHGLGRTRNFKRKLENFLLFRKITRIIAVANSVKEDILRSNGFLSTEKLFVMENSIDYKRFADVSVSKEDAKQMLELPSNAFVFGTVGRFAPAKGLSYLISAFGKAKKQIPSSQLVILGDGRCRTEYENQAANTPYRDSIHFLGHRDNVEQLLRAMDVFVLASVAEGMPRALLEAMAAGVPCIGTKTGGMPEVISNKDVGYVVPSADSNALAQAMISLANLPDEDRQALIEKAKAQVQKLYSHDVVKAKLDKLYQDEYLFSHVTAKQKI